MAGSRVGVLMGGWSAEREVSLRSGAAIASALIRRGHDVARVVLGPPDDPYGAIRRAKIDVAFVALHGRWGEDGCVQGLLELCGVPYTGSGVLASALAMDKAKAKELFRLHNVPTPPSYALHARDGLADLEDAHGSFGFPVVVKPCGEGSSVGLRVARSIADLGRAAAEAFAFDDAVLVERFVSGREVTVGLLDGRVLGALEVAPKEGLYDYEAKYTPGKTEYFIPARLAPTRIRGVLNLAERAASSLGVSGPARVDMIVTEGENEYVLEVNTLPGMTETSLLPKIAAAAGYGFADLCEAILGGARLHAGRPAGARRDRALPAPDVAATPASIPARAARSSGTFATAAVGEDPARERTGG